MSLALHEGDRIRRRTCALILAAGRSSRMGRFKPLLPLGDLAVVERVIQLFRAAGVSAVYVVVGHRAEDLRTRLAASGATLVSNPRYAEGMFSSVQAGLAAVGTGFGSIFIQPVDVPLVRPATVRLLLAALADHPGKAIHPTWKGQRGHPPLVPASLVPVIQSHDGTGGLRALLDAPTVRSVEIPVPDRYILMDMDEPECYTALRQTLAGHEIPDEAECEVLLRSTFGVTGDLLQHCRTVAAVATNIAARLRQRGCDLDLKLVRAGALLHDIAKGEKDHARRGGQYLQRLGFDRVAQIVARHVDLLPDAKDLVSVPEVALDEAAVVFIADKHISGNAPISLGARFDRSLKRFGTFPAAQANIERRRQTARVVRDRIEGALGVCLGDLVAAVLSGGDAVGAGGETPK
jgi:putative nucleotidyltransferase with HDIG domain